MSLPKCNYEYLNNQQKVRGVVHQLMTTIGNKWSEDNGVVYKLLEH